MAATRRLQRVPELDRAVVDRLAERKITTCKVRRRAPDRGVGLLDAGS